MLTNNSYTRRVMVLVLLVLTALSGQLSSMDGMQIENQLFDQILFGEATFRDDIVKEALAKLERMNPDNPRVIAARIRFLVQQQQINDAEKILLKLGQIAPKSIEYKKMTTLIGLNRPLGAKKLFQANMLVITGKFNEAKLALDALYQGNPPTFKLAIDYWVIVAKIPEERASALEHLQEIYNRFKKIGLLDSKINQRERWQTGLVETLSATYVNEGESYLAQDNLPKAKTYFHKALEIYPDNYFAYIGLGDIAFKKQNHAGAKEAYQKAIAIDPQGNLGHYNLIAVYEVQSAQRALDYIQSLSPFIQQKLLSATKRLQSKILQQKAIQYSEKGQWRKAVGLYEKALTMYPDDIWGTYGLAIVYAELGKLKQGISAFNRLAAKEKNNPVFVYAYALFYSSQELNDKALKLLKSLDRSKWDSGMIELSKRIRFENMLMKAEQFVNQNNLRKALSIYKEIYQAYPEDVWLVYDYASVLEKVGQRSRALSLFVRLAHQQPNNAPQAYAYALFLSSINLNKQALRHLNTISHSKWDSSMKELAERLKDAIHIEYALSLRSQGLNSLANAYLMRQKPSERILLTLARWALEDENIPQAYHYYQRVLHQFPDSVTAYIGLIDTYLADNKTDKALNMLRAIQPRVVRLPIDVQRSVANAWLEADRPDRALAIFNRIVPLAKQQPPSQETAWIFRDAAVLDVALIRPEAARKNYEWAMVQSGITASLPVDDRLYTSLTRTDSEDDWLKRSIRAQAADLYKDQSHVITLENDAWEVEGTPGPSDYKANNAILHYKAPYKGGIYFIRGDKVELSAGRFASQNGVFVDDFGTCEVGCTRDFNQKAAGFGVISGWYNDTWLIRLGVTPIGFDVVNPLVEIDYSGDFHNIGWTLSAQHTPLTNSLLAFSGTRDPNTGITWGGVTSTGLNLALSYDRGGKHGFWGNVLGSYLRGKNVADNTRAEFMAGYYYKLINKDHQRLTIGLNSLFWHYKRDLNRYTLGSGGYFSPQRFLTFSIPASYRHRTQNWSWMVETSVGMNRTTTTDVPLYPLPSLVPNELVNPNPIRTGSTSKTKSYYFLFGLERRLSSHFRVGGIVDVQRSPDFAPNHILFYLRYTLEPWQGDLDLPLRPISPLTNYR